MRVPATAVMLGMLAACGARVEAPVLPGPPAAAEVPWAHVRAPPVVIDADGSFVLEGKRTVVFGVEEEHHHYTREELDELIPVLKESGVTFLVVYLGNPQEDFFYERLEAEGLWVAQDLGNVKKQALSPFPNTGGVIGDLPDEATIEKNLTHLRSEVPRLSRFRNILFWWMGGEFAEPAFHSATGRQLTRDSIRRYADTVRALDPLRRPFTVSHHYIEALEEPALAWLDLSDLTDFTWLTVATHFHQGDFVAGGGWSPVAQQTEQPLALRGLLSRAWELNAHRPLFLGGMFGQAPSTGPCTAADQGQRLEEKWKILSSVPFNGSSTYHLSSWEGNDIPHALLERVEGGWRRTAAGEALQRIALTP